MTSTLVSTKSKDWIPYLQLLRDIFSKEQLNNMAKEINFNIRKRKILPIPFIELCLFSSARLAMDSLKNLCATYYNISGQDIAAEALNQRFNKQSVHFLKTLLVALMKNQFLNRLNIETMPFNRIRILDSTMFKTPTKKPDEGYTGFGFSCVKIQYEFDIINGEILAMDVGDAAINDITYAYSIANTIKENDLILRDCAYQSIKELDSIQKQQGYYIAKLKHTNIFYLSKNRKSKKYKSIDFTNEIQPGETIEIKDVYVTDKLFHVPRMVVYRLTEEQEKERDLKRGAREKHKGTSKKSNKQRHPIYIYLTNTREEDMPTEKMYHMYAVRWQVELMFKAWKSHFDLSKLKMIKRDRLDCHLYATLISILLSTTMMFKMRTYIYNQKQKQVSEVNVINFIRVSLKHIYDIIFEADDIVNDYFHRLTNLIVKNGTKSKRNNNATPLDTICSLGIVE